MANIVIVIAIAPIQVDRLALLAVLCKKKLILESCHL